MYLLIYCKCTDSFIVVHNMQVIIFVETLFVAQMSFADAPGQYACISHMMTYYKWLFQVDEKEEEKREEVSRVILFISKTSEADRQTAHYTC